MAQILRRAKSLTHDRFNEELNNYANKDTQESQQNLNKRFFFSKSSEEKRSYYTVYVDGLNKDIY